MHVQGGVEWIVDVDGLAAARIAGEDGCTALRALFAALIRELELHPLHEPLAHIFAEPRGVTLLVALTESHLACHSYPEAGALSLNLYTCRARPAPDWHALVTEHLGAARVQVRAIRRGRSEVGAPEELAR